MGKCNIIKLFVTIMNWESFILKTSLSLIEHRNYPDNIYPAFSTSSLIAWKHVSFLPLIHFAEHNIQAPWQIVPTTLSANNHKHNNKTIDINISDSP